MRIALIGYGKMGKTIEKIAKNRNHQISFIIDVNNQDDLQKIKPENTDVAIEFTQPESAYINVKHCIENQVPIVCGTTGWLEKKAELEKYCIEKSGSFFYASNYSIGVNLFFHLNKVLAKMMSKFPEYEVDMEEVHHTEKRDAPSGTAITLAEGLMAFKKDKKKWVNNPTKEEATLSIISKRIENVPGMHTVFYKSGIDEIEIKHTAFNREGFATVAVMAAEWIFGKKGVFGMDDMMDFE